MRLLTIGLPVYNAEAFLKDCISSILNQTYKDYELIIVDDGSTDNSISIIKQFDDPRIELIEDGKNKGLIERLNQISKMCETKYLARMDADDIMHFERLKTQMDILTSNPEIDVLGTNVYSIDSGNIIKGVRSQFNGSEEVKIREVKSFVHPSIIGKSVWFKNNPYDKRALRIEDKELWYRTVNKSNFYCIKKPLLYYREFGGEYFIKYKKAFPSFFSLSLYNFRKGSLRKSWFWFKRGFFVGGKFLVYGLFILLGKENILFHKRNVRLTDNQLVLGKKDLNISIEY